jgi:hypothetical protein
VLVGRQHAGRGDGVGPREAAGDVVLDQALVEGERSAELEDVLVGLAGETAGPEIAHGDAMRKTMPPRLRRPA